MTKTRVLVTGGAGYLGAVLSERLLEVGYRVTVVDNLLFNQQSLFHLFSKPEFSFVRGDVRDQDLMQSLISKSDVLIPLAALVGAPACDNDPWFAESVNFGAIEALNKMRDPEQLVVFPEGKINRYGKKSNLFVKPCCNYRIETTRIIWYILKNKSYTKSWFYK